MQTLGRKINQVRKLSGMKSADLADAIGISPSSMSYIERDFSREGPSPETVVKIADVLDDKSILIAYLENNLVYQSIIPKIFRDLNNLRRDPEIIFSRFAIEAEKSVQAARFLSDLFSNEELTYPIYFDDVFKAKLKTVADVQSCSEVLFLQLIMAGIITDEDRGEINAYQIQKCADHVSELEVGDG